MCAIHHTGNVKEALRYYEAVLPHLPRDKGLVNNYGSLLGMKLHNTTGHRAVAVRQEIRLISGIHAQKWMCLSLLTILIFHHHWLFPRHLARNHGPSRRGGRVAEEGPGDRPQYGE